MKDKALTSMRIWRIFNRAINIANNDNHPESLSIDEAMEAYNFLYSSDWKIIVRDGTDND